MLRLQFLAPLLLAAAAEPSLRGAKVDWEQCGLQGSVTREETERIVHGRDADECVWRWQVSLKSVSNGQFCGGTLVEPGWVLTAAHCLADVTSNCAVRNLRVEAGSWRRNEDLGKTKTSVERRVKKIYVHPLYQQNVPHDYDFALIQLDKAMPINECIGTACLPRSEEMPGTECSITGWGTVRSMGPTPEVLQEAGVQLLASSECEANYTETSDVITGSMLCATGMSDLGITDTCQGDSGGPLACKEDGRHVLRGVTSWGQGCAFPNFPGVYSRVQTVMSWIDDVLAAKVKKVSAQDEQELQDLGDLDFQGSMWQVVEGKCTLDAENCILSPNFPEEYGTSETCKIAVNTSAAVPIQVANFSTELRFDSLMFDCKYFSGDRGPEGLVPQGAIAWSSDESVVSSGWRLCPS
ncbi:unnamed protein product [Effrenium voratum]|nr:unnamed protein product [Effrenium voratum]